MTSNPATSTARKPLRILHIVTLVTTDGAFGGPVRVAENLTDYLSGEGHDVTVVACRGEGLGETEQFRRSTLRLFPTLTRLYKRSFVLTTSLWALLWVLRNRGRFDVVHVHLARDLMTGPLGWLAASASTRVIVQPHGMVMPRDGLVYRIFDAFTINPILAHADEVLYLNDAERHDLESVVPKGKTLRHLANGVPMDDGVGTVHEYDDTSRPLEFLFLSRLHERKRPVDFVRAAVLVNQGAAQRGLPRARFALAGPDEGSAAAVQECIDVSGMSDDIRWEGPVEPSSVLGRFAKTDVFVLPSIAEPFGMVVLEAMSMGVPVIVTTECGLADLVTEFDAGVVVEPGPEPLANAMNSLIDDRDRLRKLSANALRAAQSMSVGGVGRRLMELYTA